MTRSALKVMGHKRPRWMDDEAAQLHDVAASFFAREFGDNYERWSTQQFVDRDVWERAGELGLLCCSIPQKYGGGGGQLIHDLAVIAAQASVLALDFGNTVHSGIVAHYLLAFGTEEQKGRWLPAMASGEAIGAIAMTEPAAGSDLRGIRSRAKETPMGYVLDGQKTFISNATQADVVIVAARLEDGSDSSGISLFLLDTRDSRGFSRGQPLRKLGQHASDTAELFFDSVELPSDALLGIPHRGMHQLMSQLGQERLFIAVAAAASMERALVDTIAYTKDRRLFGGNLFDLQNTRFELAECATIVRVAHAFVDDAVLDLRDGLNSDTTAAMAKLWVTEMQSQVLDRCLQLFGGYGFMAEYPIARAFIDSRVQRIYGGASEVMKEVIARAL